MRSLTFAAAAGMVLCSATGCGRLGFDALAQDDAGDDVEDDANVASIDARPTGPSIPLEEVTPEQPLFRASDNPIDDSYYVISTVGTQRASSFVYNEKAYFVVPSKSSDAGTGGWHYAIIHWTPGEAEAVWLDGSKDVGDQALLLRNATDSNGMQLRNHQTTHLISTPSGFLGLSKKFFSDLEYPDVPLTGFYWVGMQVGAPENLLGTSFLVDNKAVIDINDNDGTWRGSTTGHADLYFKDGEVLIYQTQLDSPADETPYIAVTRTSDMVSFELPTEPILEGYSRAQVFEYNAQFYMVAFSSEAERWQLLPGTAFDTFDTSAAVNIELGAALHGTGDWDDTPLLSDLPNGEPRIAGVDVIGGEVYLFYLAGSFGQLADDPRSAPPFNGVPYDGPRGIGAFKLTMPTQP